MATMKGRRTNNAAEQFAYDQMRAQLPHDWVVLSNVSWVRREVDEEHHGAGYLRHGQTDFVVLVPELGLLVVEIKGSAGYRIAEDGRWFRKKWRPGGQLVDESDPMPESPPEQASRNMFSLVSHCNRVMGWSKFPGLYGCVVWYPNCKVAEGKHFDDSSTVLVASDNSNLVQRFRSTLSACGSPEVAEKFIPARRDEVSQSMMSEGYRLNKADTAVDIKEDLGAIKALTASQSSALQGIFWNDRVAVTGPAGSGKTLLGIWRARASKGQGRRTLFVCYNRKLADYLRFQFPDLSENVVHVDKLFRDNIIKHVAFPHPPADPVQLGEFWRENVPGMIFDYLPSETELYDTIIVDEGQDFSFEQQAAVLEFLRREAGQYAYFWDAGQDLYKQKMTLPVGTNAFFVLEYNCRNTKRICETATKIGQRRVPSMPGMPEGLAPVVELAGSNVGMANRCWSIVNEWRSASDGRIAVLSPYTLANSSLASHRKAHGLRLVEDPAEWDSTGAVLFSTIKSFKGIEADGVVVIDLDVPAANSALRVEDLYVACTRPVARLALLSSSPSGDAYLRAGIGGTK